MTLTQLQSHLQENGISVYIEDNKICSISMSADASLSDKEAWELIDRYNLRAVIQEEQVMQESTPTASLIEEDGKLVVEIESEQGVKSYIIDNVNE